jgi:hypothetical protein
VSPVALDLVKDLSNEAAILHAQGNLPAALARLDEALALCARSPNLASGHHAQLHCKAAKVWLLATLRRSKEAQTLAEQVVAAAEALSSSDPENALVALEQMATYVKEFRNTAKTMPESFESAVWNSLMTLSGQHHGMDHPRYLQLQQKAPVPHG